MLLGVEGLRETKLQLGLLTFVFYFLLKKCNLEKLCENFFLKKYPTPLLCQWEVLLIINTVNCRQSQHVLVLFHDFKITLSLPSLEEILTVVSYNIHAFVSWMKCRNFPARTEHWTLKLARWMPAYSFCTAVCWIPEEEAELWLKGEMNCLRKRVESGHSMQIKCNQGWSGRNKALRLSLNFTTFTEVKYHGLEGRRWFHQNIGSLSRLWSFQLQTDYKEEILDIVYSLPQTVSYFWINFLFLTRKGNFFYAESDSANDSLFLALTCVRAWRVPLTLKGQSCQIKYGFFRRRASYQFLSWF